jgi:hypothetical protein
MRTRMLISGLLTLIAATILLAQRGDGSNMSQQEMWQIRGACSSTCYITNENSCRIYGEIQCVDGEACPGEEYRESDQWYHYYTTQGVPNNKVPRINGLVPCYTRYSVQGDTPATDKTCYTLPPSIPDPPNWFSYWYWCKTAFSYECIKCMWGSPLESSSMVYDYECI